MMPTHPTITVRPAGAAPYPAVEAFLVAHQMSILAAPATYHPYLVRGQHVTAWQVTLKRAKTEARMTVYLAFEGEVTPATVLSSVRDDVDLAKVHDPVQFAARVGLTYASDHDRKVVALLARHINRTSTQLIALLGDELPHLWATTAALDFL